MFFRPRARRTQSSNATTPYAIHGSRYGYGLWYVRRTRIINVHGLGQHDGRCFPCLPLTRNVSRSTRKFRWNPPNDARYGPTRCQYSSTSSGSFQNFFCFGRRSIIDSVGHFPVRLESRDIYGSLTSSIDDQQWSAQRSTSNCFWPPECK